MDPQLEAELMVLQTQVMSARSGLQALLALLARENIVERDKLVAVSDAVMRTILASPVSQDDKKLLLSDHQADWEKSVGNKRPEGY